MVVKHDLLKQMSEYDNSQQEGMNLDNELEVEQNQDNVEDIEALREELEKEREAKRQILARAKKAEEQLKEKFSQTAPSVEQKPTQNNLQATLTAEDVEVKILKAQGMQQDEIEYLKKIAKVEGISIIEAQSNDLFTGFKAKKEAEEKAEKAKLPASRASGSVRREKNITTPGLTDTEHKELWKRQMGI